MFVFAHKQHEVHQRRSPLFLFFAAILLLLARKPVEVALDFFGLLEQIDHNLFLLFVPAAAKKLLFVQ